MNQTIIDTTLQALLARAVAVEFYPDGKIKRIELRSDPNPPVVPPKPRRSLITRTVNVQVVKGTRSI